MVIYQISCQQIVNYLNTKLSNKIGKKENRYKLKGINSMIEYIGIDLGGTNVRVGAMDENENIVFEYKEETFEGVKTAEDLYLKIVNLIKKVPEYEMAKSIGLGVPGCVDVKTGNIVTARNVGILKDYPLKEKLENEFNKKIYIDNDAKVTAFAEALRGKGKDKNIVSYITISTGFGGGVVINKDIYHGSNNLGGYFSRIILDGENTTDYLISGTALKRQVKENLNIDIKDTSELFKLGENGNQVANAIIEKFKNNLVATLLNITATINPDIIVLGGGVIKSKGYFLDDVINKFRQMAHDYAKNTIIEVSDFEEPGIIGACLLAKYSSKK